MTVLPVAPCLDLPLETSGRIIKRLAQFITGTILMSKTGLLLGVFLSVMSISACKTRVFNGDEQTSTPEGLDIANNKIIDLLKSKGIQPTFDETSFQNLVKYYDALIHETNQKMGSASNNAKKDLKKALKFYEHGNALLKKQQTPREKVASFYLGVRILYGVSTFDAPAQAFNPLQPIKTLSRLKSTMPYVTPNLRAAAIGDKQAQLESQLLVDPNNPSQYVSESALAKLSTEAVSRLDISDDHPFWMNESLHAKHPAYWEELERFIEKSVNQELKVNNFTLKDARKVLFLDAIKESATSPKIDTKDNFKLDWKLKWGDEIVSENVSTRLAVKLGQKLADMVYAVPPGRDELLLVLGDPKKPGQCIDNINTIELFSSCLLKSKYKFDVRAFIGASGTITAQNSADVLKNLPEGGKYKQADLVGRSYVSFKESMVEFKGDKVFVRGGAVAGSFLGAETDRALRGAFVFNMWLGSVDVKDENNRSILVPDFLGSGKQSYFEIIHDYGASLGTVMSGFGSINNMSTNEKFMEVKKGLLDRDTKIHFEVPLLYKPKAWENSTFADGLWMARRIAKTPRAAIENAVASVPWPSYARKALVQKILLRRNDIAKAFGVENELDEKSLQPLNISVSLRTAIDRARAAEEFGLSLVQMEQRLKAAKKLNADGTAIHEENLVINNELVECKKSLITGMLELNKHPTGLQRRLLRLFDFRALGDCGFSP